MGDTDQMDGNVAEYRIGVRGKNGGGRSSLGWLMLASTMHGS